MNKLLLQAVHVPIVVAAPPQVALVVDTQKQLSMAVHVAEVVAVQGGTGVGAAMLKHRSARHEQETAVPPVHVAFVVKVEHWSVHLEQDLPSITLVPAMQSVPQVIAEVSQAAFDR